MKRRNFLKTAFLGTIAGTVGLRAPRLMAGNASAEAAEANPAALPDIVAVMGGEPVDLYTIPNMDTIPCSHNILTNI